MTFTKYLIDWYLKNKRPLPWRTTKDPYAIWLSEIILQQTRVAQGMSYYEAFLQSFPTLSDLALADQEQVLKLWQGLGYYSRARNLHHTAQYIHEQLQGVFPNTYSSLLQLKGVGPYTAAALASFAFDEQVGVVDGNVFRVLSRYFGIFDDISLGKTRLIFQNLTNELLQEVDAATYNHAIMDFGAVQCVPKSPKCELCILQETCYAYRNNKVTELPVKSKKVKVTHRWFYYFIVKDPTNKIAVQMRTANDIWQSLYEFPLIETQKEVPLETLTAKAQEVLESTSIKVQSVSEPVLHKLSHQVLHIYFVEVAQNAVVPNYKSWEEVIQLPFPIVLWTYLQRHPF